VVNSSIYGSIIAVVISIIVRVEFDNCSGEFEYLWQYSYGSIIVQVQAVFGIVGWCVIGWVCKSLLQQPTAIISTCYQDIVEAVCNLLQGS